MGTIIHKSKIKINSFASISTFQFQIFTIVNEDKPEVLTYTLINPDYLSTNQGLKELEALRLRINFLFLFTSLSCKEFVIVLI